MRGKIFVGNLGDGFPIPLFILSDWRYDNLLKRYGNDFRIVKNLITNTWGIYRVDELTHEITPMIFISDTDEFGYEYVAELLRQAKKDTDEIRGKIAKLLEQADKDRRRLEEENRQIRKEENIKILENIAKERIIVP